MGDRNSVDCLSSCCTIFDTRNNLTLCWEGKIEEFIKNLEFLTVSIAPFGLGILFAIIFRFIASKLRTDGENLKNIVYDGATILSLSLLLPLHIFLTILSKNLTTIRALIFMSAFGALVCLCIFLYSKWVVKFKYFAPAFPHSRYLASTFGGGNRGVMLIFAIVAFAPSAIPEAELTVLVDSFALLDAGYYFFFTMIIYPFFMPADFSNGRKIKPKVTPNLREVAIPLGAILALVLRLIDSGTIQDFIGVDNIQEIRRWMGYLMGMVATVAITMKFNFKKTIGGMRKLIFSIIFTRVLGFVSVFFIAWLALPRITGDANSSLNLIVVIPLIVLAICPPSSLVGPMMEKSGASKLQISDSATLSSSWAFLFVALVFLVYLLTAIK